MKEVWERSIRDRLLVSAIKPDLALAALAL